MIFENHLRKLGYSINEMGHLALNGVDLVKIIQDQDSERPLYVLDELKIRHNINLYKTSLKKYYPAPSSIFYASKTLQNLSICALMHQEGIGFDVCSLGEMAIAQKAGVPFSNMIFHGNNKSEGELKYAILSSMGRIIVDNESELDLIEKVCISYKIPCAILLRINPEIEVDSHKYLATGVKESKFGMVFNLETIALIRKISQNPYIKFCGLHYHIGSQILCLENFLNFLTLSLDHLRILKEEYGIVCQDLDMGGGLGIQYLPTDKEIDISFFIESIAKFIVAKAKEYNLELPRLILEPGRSLMGNTGCTLYKIGTIKKLSNGLMCAAVNGGMTDNLRPVLYQAKYYAIVANKMKGDNLQEKYRIVGKCCEPGDILIDEVQLPVLSHGDILATFATGAYSACLSSNYNKHTLPGMILVRDKTYDWIVKEQPIEDLIRYDIVPAHLKKTSNAA